jgi:hypothetical protein
VIVPQTPKTRTPESGGVQFHVSDGALVLTVPASSVWRCGHCEDYHVRLLARGDAENLIRLAAGIAHLAEHVLEGEGK